MGWRLFICVVMVYALPCQGQEKTASMATTPTHPAILQEEFVQDVGKMPTPECHASTMEVVNGVTMVSWFGGTKEQHADVGIWFSRKVRGNWSAPREVANGIQEDGSRFPCWNPVLFKPEGEGTLLYLFYKVGPSPQQWWGLYRTSLDNGITWSLPVRLPEGILGPIKNRPFQTKDGTILSPSSVETPTGEWTIHLEISRDSCKTWTRTDRLNDPGKFKAIQPVVLGYGDGNMQLLSRTAHSFIAQNWSRDGGETWSVMSATSLPNPNSGIDGVTLMDGRQLVVYNPTGKNWGARVPLSIALSRDGIDWSRVLDLEPLQQTTDGKKEEYSYPTVIQANDGLVHIVYTWNRKTIKYVVLDPAKLKG